MEQTSPTYYSRELMARVIFSWLFIILVYFFCTNSLLSQLQEPVFIFTGSDNTLWLLHILHIPQLLLQHHWVAIAFDVILTTSCLICIFVPQQRLFTWITVIGVWLLYICFGSAAGKLYAQIGFVLTPIAFLAFKQDRFELLWQAIRYWICLLYVCGGIYKIYYGGFFYAENMSHLLEGMNAEWLVFHPDGIRSAVIRYLISHASLAQWLFRLAVLVDLLLVVGLFTRKYDKWLLAGLVSFHLTNFLLLHIPFVEHSLIFAPFLPWQKLFKFFQSNSDNG